jgi:DNA-binding MarR family transcriptional regulator
VPTGHERADRVTNLLGAFALVLGDRTEEALDRAIDGPATAAAALSALLHILDRPSIDRLGGVLGLTSSGTVRLVDRLVEAGYVSRGRGSDRRSSVISLTAAGRRAAERISSARAEVLGEALSVLSPRERDSFEELVSRVLVAQIRGPGATRWMCRMCDTAACGREQGRCPVANAARERFAS